MSNYSDKWYNDSIKWYVSDSYLNAELPLFTEVRTVFTAEVPGTLEYNTYQELQNGDFNWLRTTAYSVERSSVDEIVLTCRYPLGSPTVNSLALISKVGNSAILLAKISRDTSAPIIVPNGLDRVFKIKLPYKTVGSEKIYPNISLRLKRYASSPVGEELVTVGEHHHNVSWGSGDNRDSFPTLPQTLSRYVASSEYNKQDGFSGTSYVYNESGTHNSSVASITGRLTIPRNADISATYYSRVITDGIKNLLANVMEEYLMATNSIQILGHEIDRITATNPVETDNNENTNLLYVTRTDATNTRALKAVRMDTFRDWLVKKFSYTTVSECATTACVNLIDSTKNVTVNLQKSSQVALVSNVNSVNSNINTSITVSSKTGGISLTLYPREAALIMRDGSGNYSGFKIGSTDLLRNVLDGTYGFSKVSFSSTAGSVPSSTDTGYISNAGANGISVSGKSTFSDKATFSDELSVVKKATFSDELSVVKKATFSDELDVAKKASIGTSLTTAQDALAVAGKAKVTGAFEGTSMGKFGDKLTVTSNGFDVTGNSKITGQLETTKKITIDSEGLTVTAGGATITAGGLTVSAGGATISGNSKITGTLETTKKIIIDSEGLEVTAGGITASGQTVTAGSISAGSSTFTGEVSVSYNSATTTIANNKVTSSEGSFSSVTGVNLLEVETLNVTTVINTKKINSTDGFFIS